MGYVFRQSFLSNVAVNRYGAIRVHQHANGVGHDFDRAIGQSKGGITTKIHLVTDVNRLPIDFKITVE